ncbi:hypothetical protein SAY86_004744 [Trapa natans]|uniref:Uncharacterized protein n=1 Tax=Trapa natans TaxID=22666 RepID=A0AAN7MG59_TRANT|nr:hypothetical protein SAY86_004744 [Trapa natans]
MATTTHSSLSSTKLWRKASLAPARHIIVSARIAIASRMDDEYAYVLSSGVSGTMGKYEEVKEVPDFGTMVRCSQNM